MSDDGEEDLFADPHPTTPPPPLEPNHDDDEESPSLLLQSSETIINSDIAVTVATSESVSAENPVGVSSEESSTVIVVSPTAEQDEGEESNNPIISVAPEAETSSTPSPTLVTPLISGIKRKVDNDDEKTDSPRKKSKSENEDEDDDDDGSCCTICFESWTNSGDHRISSLKCGHFFGYVCIEKWLKGSGNACPNCNEKATRRDIRTHFVAKLKAIDTSEKDRAIADLDNFKIKYRQMELEHTTLKINSKLQQEEIGKLQAEIAKLYSSGTTAASSILPTLTNPKSTSESGLNEPIRLVYKKRLELIKESSVSPKHGCRIMCYDENRAMLIVTMPSYTALAPGFGVKRINLMDLNSNSNSFVSLHKEPIRDLAFNPSNSDQLLSVSQDKVIKLTNISSCSEIMKYTCESEIWSCAWNWDSPCEFFVGTKRSQLFLYDTRSASSDPKLVLTFPVVERRPIISLAYVPECQRHAEFPVGGLLVLTLGSLWFFKRQGNDEFTPYKLPIEGLFWSLRFDVHSRMVLVSTKPSPRARHIVSQLTLVEISNTTSAVSCSIIMDYSGGGTFSEKSFLRSTIFPKMGNDGISNNVLCAYSKGSSGSDHKTTIQEVGSDRIVQELPVRKPILDIWPCTVNDISYLACLSENEVFIYKWTQ